jgi:hypothetical protein
MIEREVMLYAAKSSGAGAQGYGEFAAALAKHYRISEERLKVTTEACGSGGSEGLRAIAIGRELTGVCIEITLKNRLLKPFLFFGKADAMRMKTKICGAAGGEWAIQGEEMEKYRLPEETK